MSGGIIQLVAYGKEDLFLTRDPQITFFKIIYRRHTNFAREDIPQSFIADPDFGKRSTCIPSVEGDLISRMALRIILPAVPKLPSNNVVSDGAITSVTTSTSTNTPTSISTTSITSTSTTSTTNLSVLDSDTTFTSSVNILSDTAQSQENTATKFAWIRRIGQAMIKYIEIEINGEVIDRHYGEWLYIWSILTTRNINDDGLKKLIGDVPELTEFTESKDSYTLYVPLQFWFCRNSGLSLPLISLQYSRLKINMELFDLDKCIIVSPTNYIKCVADIVNFLPYEYLIQKGADNIERYGIFSRFDIINKRLYYTAISPDKFIGVPYDGDTSVLDNTTKSALLNTPKSDRYVIKGVFSDFTIKPDLGVRSVTTHKRSFKNIKLKDCVLLIDYVYLDDDERMIFAQTKHDYLIEQLYFTPNIAIEGTNPKAKLDIDQPCKLTVWLAQLDYISDFNDRFNYTDSHIRKRVYNVDFINNDPTKTKIYSEVEVGDEVGNSLIDEEVIRLNSQIRLSKRENEYFEYIQPFQHANNRLPKGCEMYSYAILPTDAPPSGTTNMSQIELIELVLKMNYRVNITQKAKFRSYSLCYNVWRVENGLSATVFVR
jgi:hypothetical protein